MKIFDYLGGLLVAVSALLMFPATAVSSGHSPGKEEPSYVSGEVAVYATPDEVKGWQIRKVLPNAGITVLAVQAGTEQEIALQLQSEGKQAGVNRIAQAFAVPNDPLYSPFQWHFTRIQSEEAWDITDGTDTVVAVLDSGLTTDGAEDGIDCVSPLKYDVVNQDNDPADGDGHGTHVSGTVAQATNNAVGTAGIAHGACVMPVKVMADDGTGTSADIAEGIYYAVNNGAQVINMSLGFSARFRITNDPIMDPALDNAYANEVTVVCAAGNESSSASHKF